MNIWLWLLLTVSLLLAGLAVYDLTQVRHAILRNFPLIGHLRYLLEMIGPELRQYIVTSNNEERPFNRDQRTWVYASAKKQNNLFGFGTDADLEHGNGYLILKHAAFPWPDPKPSSGGSAAPLPCAKVLGAARKRVKAFRPESIVNVSAMSFGSLSGRAVEAINRGCRLAGCLHNTGEGGISPHHGHGGELIWQIGTGYFGCRDAQGRFSLERLVEGVERHPVRALEIKLSQGAKPGKGGILPAAKVTPEIAAIRGIPVGEQCHSPSRHAAFSDADSLLDFVERIAEATGLPIGIKSAVGELAFWDDLTRLMSTSERGVDFVAIDGGEGGTGAAPLVYSDHVALPFKLGFARVYAFFARRELKDDVVFAGSGRLGFPEQALFAFALGCDLIHLAREPMLAIGCIQAQRCHTGHCPTGVATQSAWLMRGLDPTSKAARMANYVTTLRGEIAQLARSCGVAHPALLQPDQLELLDERFGAVTVRERFDYAPGWGLVSQAQRGELLALERGGWRVSSPA